MCAIYQPAAADTIRELFQAPEVTFDYKPECYPGYSAPVLMASETVADELLPVRAMFGLVPPWAKDTKISRMTYNARSETIAKLPSYRKAWAERRFCVVPANAFYEPNYESGKPVRWAIKRTDGQPFGIAAIWERWKTPEGDWMRSFSMVTINATEHALMRRFHAPEDEKRSIVVIPPDRYQDWLHAGSDDEARSHLAPFNPDEFAAEAAPAPPAKRKKPEGPAAESAPGAGA